MILDVGCCACARGNVNIDLIINRTAPNFVRCDAQHLPFKDNVFALTLCYCLLEHLSKPYEGLKELFRVTGDTVTIRYDKLFSIYNFIGVGHKNMMVKERFVRLPSIFFNFLYKAFMFRPLKAVCRRAGIFEAQTYERTYNV